MSLLEGTIVFHSHKNHGSRRLMSQTYIIRAWRQSCWKVCVVKIAMPLGLLLKLKMKTFQMTRARRTRRPTTPFRDYAMKLVKVPQPLSDHASSRMFHRRIEFSDCLAYLGHAAASTMKVHVCDINEVECIKVGARMTLSDHYRPSMMNSTCPTEALDVVAITRYLFLLTAEKPDEYELTSPNLPYDKA